MPTSQAKAPLANAIFASKRCEKGCGEFRLFRTIFALADDPIIHRANVDAPMQKVFDIPQRERKPHIHHNCQADDLWARLEVTKGGTFCHPKTLIARPARLNKFSSDGANLQDANHTDNAAEVQVLHQIDSELIEAAVVRTDYHKTALEALMVKHSLVRPVYVDASPFKCQN